ncbi:MAG TPA: P1 family peptidase, partial [Dehalococcoidia bacterium]
VVLCERGAVGGVDVRGAAPGTRETDLLQPGNLVDQVHAVLLTGGSAFGLDAASGVMRYLEERGAGYRFAGVTVPIVTGAVLMDLTVGDPTVRPDAAAGYAACLAAGDEVAEGSVGAGTGATVAKMLGMDHCLKGGVGTASERTETGIVVGALAAVNAAGDVVEPRTGAVIAGPRTEPGRFTDTYETIRLGREWLPEAVGSTTLVVVATNARLSKEQANRVATVAHDGMARAVRPAHTQGDGDVIFVLATGDVPVDRYGYRAVESLAARTVERAIVRGVWRATGLHGIPSAREWLAEAPGLPMALDA